jgi:hypothetical protein
MSLVVDKEAVMHDVMHAINKHYAGYEQNISEMEAIIKQLPMVKNIIKENEELKRILESENIHISVDEKQESVDVREDIKKELNDNMDMSFKALHDMMVKQQAMSSESDSDTMHAVAGSESESQVTRKMKLTGLGAVGIATGSHTHFEHDESEEVDDDGESVTDSPTSDAEPSDAEPSDAEPSDADASEQVVVLDRTNFHQQVIQLEASEHEEEYEEDEDEDEEDGDEVEEDGDSGSQPREDEEDGDEVEHEDEDEEDGDSGSQPREDEEDGDSGSQPREDEEEDEEEVFEVNIEDTVYYTTNEESGQIYNCTIDGDVGEVVGHFESGEAVFT